MDGLPELWLNDEEGFVYLSTYQGDPAHCREAAEADLDYDLVADYLDRRAEGSNHHDFVGLHAYLAELIADRAGAECASAVMLELLRKGGLHRVGDG